MMCSRVGRRRPRRDSLSIAMALRSRVTSRCALVMFSVRLRFDIAIGSRIGRQGASTLALANADESRGWNEDEEADGDQHKDHNVHVCR